MADAADTDQTATQPPATAGNGMALYGDYPLNLRLRAEALADDGKAEDPDGLVTPAAIAETAARLKAERADPDTPATDTAADAEPPSLAWKRDRLAEYAQAGGLDVADGDTKADILAKIEGATAPVTEG